jgi:hypothetical protein
VSSHLPPPPVPPMPSPGELPAGDRDSKGSGLRSVLFGRLGAGTLGIGGVVLAGLLLIALFGAALEGCKFEIGAIGDPGPGRDSQRLPVQVEPTTELADGTVVRVTSDAFDPLEIVGVTVCLQEADTARRGVDACDAVQGARYAVGPDGTIDATYPVPRVITIGGQAYDCAEAADRCLLVAASANDYDRSGGQPITFARDLPNAELRPTVVRPQTDRLAVVAVPAGPVVGGTTIDLAASGFQPGEPLLVAWCTEAFEVDGPRSCDPMDGMDAFGAIALRTLSDALPTADDEGRFRIEIEARSVISPPFLGAGTGAEEPGGGAAAEPVDCRATPGRCAVVIAAAADTKRSAVLPYEIARR